MEEGETKSFNGLYIKSIKKLNFPIVYYYYFMTEYRNCE